MIVFNILLLFIIYKLLAAHLEKNSNLIIAEVLKIVELLTDADLALYQPDIRHKAEPQLFSEYTSHPLL